MRNASIDLAACREAGIAVCGTASARPRPVELTWALVLGLARHLVPEATACARGGPWQSHRRARPGRRHARAARAGQDRHPGRGGRARRSAWTWSPGARTSPRSAPRPAAPGWPRPDGAAGGRRRGLPPPGARRPPGGSSARDELAAMEPLRVPGQHLAGGPGRHRTRWSRRCGRDGSRGAGPRRVRRGAAARRTTRSARCPRCWAPRTWATSARATTGRYFTEAVEDVAAWLAGEPVRRLV